MKNRHGAEKDGNMRKIGSLEEFLPSYETWDGVERKRTWSWVKVNRGKVKCEMRRAREGGWGREK